MRPKVAPSCSPESLPSPNLYLAWSLAVAADDLHFLRRHRCPVIQLEVNIFDEERPDFVTETVGM
jgi:hypothetical protein